MKDSAAETTRSRSASVQIRGCGWSISMCTTPIGLGVAGPSSSGKRRPRTASIVPPWMRMNPTTAATLYAGR